MVTGGAKRAWTSGLVDLSMTIKPLTDNMWMRPETATSLCHLQGLQGSSEKEAQRHNWINLQNQQQYALCL